VLRAGERDTPSSFVLDEGPARTAIANLIEAMRVDWNARGGRACAGLLRAGGVLEPPYAPSRCD